MRILTGLLTWALLAGPVASATAQQFTGGVRGEVRDPNGVIPGVTVSLTNEATNITRDTATNDVGQYNFPAVAPGTYTLKTQLTGYRTFESRGLVVGTQQFITLDVVLQVGTIQESVTVTGQSPLIDTSNASTGGVLDRQALESLPAPGRNAFLIGVTVPTVMPNGDPQFNRQQDQSNASLVSIGGGGIRANNYLVDGVPITELRGRAVANPTMEALEDVKVQVHTYDAELGRIGGGVFNVTARSGSNAYHGSAFYQTRPVWGQSENYFNSAACDVAGTSTSDCKKASGLSDAYYRLYGGGFGGPIKKDQTFFWFSTEGYRSGTTRNISEIWPTANQRNGDFSHTTLGGKPAVLYNPWCRGGVASSRCPATGTGSIATGGLFTNAIIPLTHPAVSQVGLNILKIWPTNTINGPMAQNEDGNTNANGTAFIVDMADMFTIKAEHKITKDWTLSGFYLYNRTNEPGSTIMQSDKLFMADQDQWFGPLRRRPHVLVFNNTNVINDTTVLTLRYGWTTWQDSCDSQPFSAGLQSLGFSPTYTNALSAGGANIFPSLTYQQTEGVGGWGPIPVRWKGPYAINGALTKLKGTHSFKIGADFRRLGVSLATESALGGTFAFDSAFTSKSGGGGAELASLLLGLPSSGSAPANNGEGEWFTRYWGAYLQDDWRVSSRLTINYGIRLEHEAGLREVNNQQTVGFDQNAVNPIDALVNKTGTLLAGKTLRGGLIYAGVAGAPDYQGDPKTIKPAPRVGATYAIDPNTVLRAGYGLYWAPWNYPGAGSGYIATGFSRTTALSQSTPESEVPKTVLDNPFPSGLLSPVGSSLGLLTNVGGQVDFVDQTKGSPKVHQYSVDVQRQLPGAMAVTIGYIGASGRDIGYGGTTDAVININQIDPSLARQLFPLGSGWDPSKLRESIPNPFFGIPQAGEFGTTSTIARGQLLRPFPEFGDILMHQTTAGSKRQYNAVDLQLDKRLGGSQRWGGRFSYTFSRTMDNQFGESSVYGRRTATPQNNYDLAAEYGVSNFDSPHRIVLAPIVQLPGPKDTKSLAYTLAGGWNASAVVELVSGPPLNAVMSSDTSDSNLGLFGGRQRPNLVGDPNVSGSDENRAASALHPDTRWFNAGAFANPGPGQFGNAPRTIDTASYQFRRNVDLVFAKDTRFGGNQIGEIRFEILNLTNTPKFGNYPSINAANLSSFGRVDIQAGFMRIWQLTFRYRF
ncbi:MAG TPA: carboxypeptidase-like regulatory domain-containing protein [Vicinamibacterales bacterium]|nr:carboxypeptidase-like regulatory domain-containing protein [Vicinamibacterales bacterium]